jgi:hypothetical protein
MLAGPVQGRGCAGMAGVVLSVAVGLMKGVDRLRERKCLGGVLVALGVGMVVLRPLVGRCWA